MSIEVNSHYKSLNDEELSVSQAKEILGWVSLKSGSKKDTHLKIKNGSGYENIHLANNLDNRPLRVPQAERFAAELLRNKWYENGEVIILSERNKIISGAHRLVGLVLAEHIRQQNPEYYRKNYAIKSSVTMPTLIVSGIKNKFADSVDTGQKRSGGDVLYRRHEFRTDLDNVAYTTLDQKKLSNILAVAGRLVWLRIEGKKVSDAPQFPISELLSWLEKHPEIKYCCQYVYQKNGGATRTEQTIGQYISLGYLAGLMYLFAYSQVDDKGKATRMGRAEDFVLEFASGIKLRALKDRLVKHLTSTNGQRLSRDELCGLSLIHI